MTIGLQNQDPLEMGISLTFIIDWSAVNRVLPQPGVVTADTPHQPNAP